MVFFLAIPFVVPAILSAVIVAVVSCFFLAISLVVPAVSAVIVAVVNCFFLAIPLVLSAVSAVVVAVANYFFLSIPFVVPTVVPAAVRVVANRFLLAIPSVVSAVVPAAVRVVTSCFFLAIRFVVSAVVSAVVEVVASWPAHSARAKQLEVEEAARRMETSVQLQRLSAEASRKVEEARLAVERKWFEGVHPECHPSDEDISRMKAQYHYSPGFIHIAVVGSAGAGKSSFINAVRGLSRNDPVPAPVGIVEITDTVTRYADPRQDSRMVWYDVPGSGTPKVPDWQYFNDMGLYIFDCIIMLTDDRFLDSGLAILRACKPFKNIEVLLIRCMSDQYINDMVCEKMPQDFDPYDPDVDAETLSLFPLRKLEERQRFIDETSQNVQMHLEREKLLPKKVHIICIDAMLATVNKIRSPKAIDEADLLNDIKGIVLERLQLGC